MASGRMRKASTNSEEREIPVAAVLILRLERGSVTRIARRLGRSASHVSKVLSGARRSERVRRAILNEAIRTARLFGMSEAVGELRKAGVK